MKTVPAPGSQDIRRHCPFDPPENYRELRDDGDLGKVVKGEGQEGWLLTSYEDVTEVLADSSRFSSRVNDAAPLPDGRVRPGWFFGMDAEEHARYRQPLTGRFTLQAMKRLAPRMESVVRGQLDAMRAGGSTADLFAAYAWPVPGLIICELLGIEHQQQEVFERQVAVFDQRDVTEEELDATFEEMWEEMLRLALEKQALPGDDLLSDLLREGEGPAAVTPEEAASIALSLRLAGQAPVAHVIAMGAFLLLQDEHWDRSVVADSARLAALVEELLRYLPTNNLGVVRAAVDTTVIGNHEVQAGDLIYVSLPVANRDPRRFTDPDRLDAARTVSSHLAFGHGIHKCLGQNLARVQLQVAFRELFEEFPALELAVPPDQIPMYETPSSYGVAELPVRW